MRSGQHRGIKAAPWFFAEAGFHGNLARAGQHEQKTQQASLFTGVKLSDQLGISKACDAISPRNPEGTPDEARENRFTAGCPGSIPGTSTNYGAERVTTPSHQGKRVQIPPFVGDERDAAGGRTSGLTVPESPNLSRVTPSREGSGLSHRCPGIDLAGTSDPASTAAGCYEPAPAADRCPGLRHSDLLLVRTYAMEQIASGCTTDAYEAYRDIVRWIDRQIAERNSR